MKVIAIAAVAKNGVIGKGLELPWDIPEDMKFFRDSTRNQIVVMGRKTYDALGKALPQRENAVITRNDGWKADDAVAFRTVAQAIEYYSSRAEFTGKTLFIIGGAEIYSLAIPFVDELWLTEIDETIEGDVFFPGYAEGSLILSGFEKVRSKKQSDFTGSPFRYSFSVFKKPQ